MRASGGALLADPVGTGKTYVALAAAQALAPEQLVEVFAPAILVSGWEETAAALGLRARVSSHERLSRGERPTGRGPAIIDESHRFRTPGTRRYRTIAPGLVGRPVVLVSATPIVNRTDDLLAQLLLAVGDDALESRGLASLREGLSRRAPPPVLSALVVREAATDRLPRRTQASAPGWLARSPAARQTLAAVDRLRLSRNPGVAALLRTSLLRALASSPAALAATIRRHRLLLEHAQAARSAGRRVSRRDVEREVGALADQLVLWELLPDPEAPADLALADRRPLERLARLAQAEETGTDLKLETLAAALDPEQPTVLFSSFVATVRYLARRLDAAGIAWVTGTRAGVGPIRYPRRLVLEAFGPGPRPAGPWRREPWLLLSTDVAAEGLNLQRARTVIHYDLPWTAVRIEQRDGRAARMGSVHPEVRVVRFDPPEEIDARLDLIARLEAKGRMPRLVGLSDRADEAWTRQRRVAERWRTVAGETGCSVCRGPSGALAAVLIEGLEPTPITVVAVLDAGAWSMDVERVLDRLESAWATEPIESEGAVVDRRGLLRDASRQIERWVARVTAARLRASSTTPVRRARAALGRRMLEARRRRDYPAMARLDLALQGLRRPATAGLESLATELVLGKQEAIAALAALGEAVAEPAGSVGYRILALLAFVD